MPALGERFTAAREARGLSVSDVAEQIRIRSVYLDAIEKEDWGAIGAPVYVRGFLRTYARFLGLDAEQIVAEFNLGEAERGPIVPTRGSIVDPDYGRPARRRLSPLIWIGSTVAILLVAFVVYQELTLSPASRPVAVAAASATPASQASQARPAAMPTATPSAQPTIRPAPPGEHAVTIRLLGLCWLRVTVDGNVVVEGTYNAGQVKTFYGKQISLRVGNAAAAELTVDGHHFGKLGGPGEVVDRSIAG
jgi:cytoskeleton protein RodZ